MDYPITYGDVFSTEDFVLVAGKPNHGADRTLYLLFQDEDQLDRGIEFFKDVLADLEDLREEATDEHRTGHSHDEDLESDTGSSDGEYATD